MYLFHVKLDSSRPNVAVFSQTELCGYRDGSHMVENSPTRMILVGGSFFLSSSSGAVNGLWLSVSFVFLSFSPSPFGSLGSLWGWGGWAVVVRGHPA